MKQLAEHADAADLTALERRMQLALYGARVIAEAARLAAIDGHERERREVADDVVHGGMKVLSVEDGDAQREPRALGPPRDDLGVHREEEARRRQPLGADARLERLP